MDEIASPKQGDVPEPDIVDVVPVQPEIISVGSEPVVAQTFPAAVPDWARINSLDVLRGFAVLGILVMNIQAFAMIDAAYMNPTAYGDLNGSNFIVWLLSHVLFDQKFMTIFSILFGAGIYLMAQRRREKGLGSAAVHYRRMGFLAMFGILHAYLFWYGDILFSYAVCGLVAYLLRRLPPWALILIGSVCLLIPSGLLGGMGLVMHNLQPSGLQVMSASVQEPKVAAQVQSWTMEDMTAGWQPTKEQIEKQLAAYRGSWWDGFRARLPMSLMMQTVVLGLITAWRAGGLMLIGMALFKLGFLSAQRPARDYAVLIALGLAVGIPVIGIGVAMNFAAGWSMLYSQFLGFQYNYWASLLVSLSWIGCIMLACQTGSLPWLTRPLAAVGQLAFTNYLMHTLICTTLFYGHGLGLYGHVERVGQIGIVAAIWTFQLIVSPIWLRYFRFGPAEWAWRSLTYLQLQPFRRTPGQESQAAMPAA